MDRRKFLASSAAAGALGLPGGLQAFQGSTDTSGRDFYLLRRYSLSSGPPATAAGAYFRDALVPALNRAGISPVGVFSMTLGAATPSIDVLMPSTSVETLIQLEDRLADDAEYQKAGSAFLNAPNEQPAFGRIESSLMYAFKAWPKLTLPPATAKKEPRIFQMRSYESANQTNHRLKVDMFNSGECEVFRNAGFHNVFFADVLVGQRMPKLTYIVSYGSVTERDERWTAFRTSEGWKKLSGSPKYDVPGMLSNITDEILTPTAYSQI
jgi:NIPSNAP